MRLELIAFTHDEATLLNVGGEGNQKDKKCSFLSTCGGGGCCVPALQHCKKGWRKSHMLAVMCGTQVRQSS